MSSQRPPERSRNARAQARHRAKRKAYIEHLEQTVQKLQMALGFSDEEVVGLPSPQVRIKELEQELEQVKKNFAAYRAALAADSGTLPPIDHSIPRRSPSDDIDHDYSGQAASGSAYLVSAPSSLHPLPPLESPLSIPSPTQQTHEHPIQSHHTQHQTIPRPPLSISTANGQVHHSHSGGQYSAHPSATDSASSTLYPRHSVGYQMPSTPSGSSETSGSTPPFSASAYLVL